MAERIIIPNKQEGVIFLPVKNGKCVIETRIKKGSGYYMHNRVPSGAVEEGEEPVITVFREAAEELGIIPKSIIHLDTFEDATLNLNFVRLHAYLIDDYAGEIAQPENEREKSIVHELSLDEADSCLTFASSRYTLHLAKERLSR